VFEVDWPYFSSDSQVAPGLRRPANQDVPVTLRTRGIDDRMIEETGGLPGGHGLQGRSEFQLITDAAARKTQICAAPGVVLVGLRFALSTTRYGQRKSLKLQAEPQLVYTRF
jgi:hypothetical protein